MKKIFFSIVAIAALAACTKSEVAYEDTPQEIGFVAVAGNITKAPVSGTAYPKGLNLYVNAFTSDWGDIEAENTPNYFANVEFEHRTNNEGKWGGRTPQYWPNEAKLYFSGYSKSGNIGSDAVASYNPYTDKLTITNYNPGTGTALGANDLMWFPKTGTFNKKDHAASGVNVNMYHTCSWITFLVQGDALTSLAGNEYTITSLEINGVNMVGNVTCAGTAENVGGESIPFSPAKLNEFVKWTNLSNDTDPYEVNIYTGFSLVGTYTPATPADGETPEIPESYTPKNIETNANTTEGGNIVVIPQTPGSINLAWTYKSPAGKTVEDSATGLSLKLNDANDLNWEPGKHYVYTITVTATEILIAPTPVEWVDGDMNGHGGVTVQ